MTAYLDPGRRERKRQALHEMLLVTANQLFRERGIAGTTVDDIAEAADVARQTVFNHFPYKEAFALELGAAVIHHAGERAQALLEAGMPALDVVQLVGEWVLEAATHDPDVAIVVARELLHSDPVRAARAATHVPLCELLQALLEQAREEGGIRESFPTDVAAARFSSVIASLTAQVACREAGALRRDLAISFDMLLHGIVKRSA
ncbi:MAG TPA: TetR/AcrR family transcriptional regulator [Chloroflexota bacterium]|nr:TetR/AcrR family transcriptional regulator [Chloroflexota bacterium]